MQMVRVARPLETATRADVHRFGPPPLEQEIVLIRCGRAPPVGIQTLIVRRTTETNLPIPAARQPARSRPSVPGSGTAVDTASTRMLSKNASVKPSPPTVASTISSCLPVDAAFGP